MTIGGVGVNPTRTGLLDVLRGELAGRSIDARFVEVGCLGPCYAAISTLSSWGPPGLAFLLAAEGESDKASGSCSAARQC